MKKFYTTLLFYLFLSIVCKATHIVGGEFGLKPLQNYRYELSLNLYFDNFYGDPGAEDQQIRVYTFDKRNHQMIDAFVLENKGSEFVKYNNDECSIEKLSTRRIKYSTEVYLNPDIYNNDAGYYVSWERCCRNGVISNIVDPGAAGMTFYMEFPKVVERSNQFMNSSPSFEMPFGEYACVGEPFVFDFAAKDSDGDLLVYRLATPLNGNTSQSQPVVSWGMPGPYSLIKWQTGHSDSAVIPGNPALSVDSVNGQLSVTPYYPGLYVFSVVCEESRNGKKIGEVRRDFQLLVRDCPKYFAPKVSMRKSQESGFYKEGDTLMISSNENRCFDIRITDDSYNERIKLKAIPVNFTAEEPLLSADGGIVNGPGDTLSVQMCGPDCSFKSDKVYAVDIIASDNSCPFPKTDTMRVHFSLNPSDNKAPVITLEPAVYEYEVAVDQEITFEVIATDSNPEIITLEGAGAGFDMSAYGMQFKNVSGIEYVRSVFSWRPDCEALKFNEGVYTVQFVVTDNSCYTSNIDTVEVRFVVKDIAINNLDYLAYNVFTPNGDGKNDSFQLPDMPVNTCAGEFQYIEIYNRWGGLVFREEIRDFVWTAEEYPAGVYYYYLQYSDKAYKGTVSLMK
jgi:gliding motility-associated-like protein